MAYQDEGAAAGIVLGDLYLVEMLDLVHFCRLVHAWAIRIIHLYNNFPFWPNN